MCVNKTSNDKESLAGNSFDLFSQVMVFKEGFMRLCLSAPPSMTYRRRDSRGSRLTLFARKTMANQTNYVDFGFRFRFSSEIINNILITPKPHQVYYNNNSSNTTIFPNEFVRRDLSSLVLKLFGDSAT